MIANELIVLNAKKQICNYSMFKDDIFSHEIESLRKISLLSVIKLETSDFVFVFCFFFASDNLSAYFKTEMIYRMVNRNLKAVKPGLNVALL